MLTANALRSRLAQTLPFYYGWVVFAICASTSYSTRPLMAVATLTVFVVPMTEQFGWSRGLISGAVSLGGLCAVAISPIVGRLIDRSGSGVMVAASSAVAGLCAIGLSTISQAWAFYALFVPGRTVFASPLELGTSTAVSNWFIRRRPLALALISASQGTGLALMPLAAQFIIGGWGWRNAWFSLGLYTLILSVIPPLLLLARRPEDMGLDPDPASGKAKLQTSTTKTRREVSGTSNVEEINFTVREALYTKAFWILSAFSAAGFMVQAGVSLHQVPHFIQQGLPAGQAAFMASSFAFSQVFGGFMWSTLARRFPLRFLLAMAGLSVATGAMGTWFSDTLTTGLMASGILGVGVGGLHLLLRLTWVDYYGRQYLGSIRGLTLPVQIAGQAVGPVLAGFMYDSYGNYQVPFTIFAIGASLGAVLVLMATPPRLPQQSTEESKLQK